MRFLHVAIVLAAVTILLADSAESSEAVQSQRGGLTSEGVVLWNFEGLLRASFPKAPVVSASVKPRTGALDFSCAGFCTPSARYSSYPYIFARHTTSAYRLISQSFRGSWGNYRRQMLIRGRSIACNSKGTLFLVQQRQAVSFKLECVKPPA